MEMVCIVGFVLLLKIYRMLLKTPNVNGVLYIELSVILSCLIHFFLRLINTNERERNKKPPDTGTFTLVVGSSAGLPK